MLHFLMLIAAGMIIYGVWLNSTEKSKPYKHTHNRFYEEARKKLQDKEKIKLEARKKTQDEELKKFYWYL